KDQGQAIGVVGTGIEITHFIDEFIKSQPPGVVSMFINEDGVVQGHSQALRASQGNQGNQAPVPPSIWKLANTEEERQQLKLAMANAQAASLSNLPFAPQRSATPLMLSFDGTPRVVAIAYLAPLKWYSVAAFDASQLVGVNDFLPIVGTLLLALALTVALVFIIGNRMVITPLQHLAEGAQRMADGDFQVSLNTRRNDEIGQVTRAFNRMAAKVANALQQAQANLDTLHASEQRFASILNAVPDPILITRLSDGLVVEINAEVGRNTPVERCNVIGKTAEQLGIWLNPDEKRRFIQLIKTHGAVNNFACETAMLGVRRHDLISAVLIELDGEAHVLTISRDATDRRRQEAALRRSYDMLARIQQIAGMGIWQWYPETDRMLWSRTMYDIYQVEAPMQEELEPGFVGSMSGMVPFGFVHPDDQESCMNDVKTTLRTHQVPGTQFRIVTTSGAIRTLRSEGEVTLDGEGRVNYVFGFGQDITERLQAEMTTRASEQKFAAIFNAIPDMIGVARLSDGIVVDFNEETGRACVLPREQIIGSNANSFDLWKDRADLKRFIQILTEQGMVREFEAEIKTPVGRQMRALLSGRLFELQGETHAILIAHDVTEIRHKELALAKSLEAQQAAETARQAAEAANQLKSDFLAMISHEVRTPLGGVIGMLRFALKARELAPDTRSKLQVGLSNAEVLLQIINDILDYSKLEAGKMQLDLIDFDLPGLVRDVVTMLMERAETRGVSLYADIEPGLPVWWYGDPTRLRQILVNLIGNAVKFTHNGEVRVKVTLDQDCQVLLAVRDSGIGMSADTIARLFQKFEQADVSTARTYGGTGLGLAICKRIIDAMGGTIRVASKLKVGTTFSVTLPLTPGVAVSPPEQSASISQHSRHLHILCAEDGATNQIIVRDLVESMGHRINLVENGKQALAQLAAQDYDLLLLDSRMPEMDGLETLQRLRRGEQQVRNPGILVLAVTANVSQAERERFFAAGANGFVGKPINEVELQNEIARMISMLNQHSAPLPPSAATPNPATTTVTQAAPPASAAAAVNANPPAKPHALASFSPAARKRLVEMYLKEAPRLLQLAQDELAASNAPGFATAVHSLKGCSGYFDDGQLQELCRTLELSANAGDLAQARQQFPLLAALVVAVVEQTRGLKMD
ncbi:MAG: hypothetical protein RL748_3677, partial [Pseudomonadota bacterium]